jgi:hypothetical protein
MDMGRERRTRENTSVLPEHKTHNYQFHGYGRSTPRLRLRSLQVLQQHNVGNNLPNYLLHDVEPFL